MRIPQTIEATVWSETRLSGDVISRHPGSSWQDASCAEKLRAVETWGNGKGESGIVGGQIGPSGPKGRIRALLDEVLMASFALENQL